MEKNTILFRNFTGGYGESKDYQLLHDFLIACENEEFTYGRLDWMITHRPYLQEQFLNRIGIWEENGAIVAVDLFDTELSDIFVIALPGYEYLYPDMITYAEEHMINESNPNFSLFINDENELLKEAAIVKGYAKTQWTDQVARYDLTQEIEETALIEGYTIVSLEEERDYRNYLYCLFRGFDHDESKEQFCYDDAEAAEAKYAYERAYVNLSLKVSVKAPNGSYVAHCGMWYDKASRFAVIEPVCTHPDARQKGFGRAVVLEGLRRVKQMGAEYAVVGSNQQFYYAIGLEPYKVGTFWKKA